MRLPVVQGVIERRILVNYRVDPDALRRLLPAPFRPQLVGEHGIAGICLIRLREIRPRWAPGAVGLSSENAAHRIAVEWDEDGRVARGVYVPRRDTSSRLNALVGGRLFPGVHHPARFTVEEDDQRLSVGLESLDGETRVSVCARLATALPAGSAFASLQEASTFFEQGSVGYSATRRPGRFDGLELRTRGWKVEALAVDSVESSFFDDPLRFPADSAAFDCALLMRELPHEWHDRGTIGTPAPARSA